MENLKTLFDIRSDDKAGAEYCLLLEVGVDYCTYAYWNKADRSIDRLQFISFPEIEGEQNMQDIINTLQNDRFKSVYVGSALPQAILTPTKYFNNNYEALDIIYDQPAQEYKHDNIPEWQMVNVYSIPQSLDRLLNDVFADVQFLHAYTPAIKVYNGYVADNQLLVNFTPQHFSVLLKKETSIQLAQTYRYTTPLDVIYYLLKICSEFGLDQSSVFIILSGLVEKDSALFTDIQQYFTNVHFAHPPDLKLPENSLPHHFFTSLYNLATCVS